ncbi:MAG: polysialyltransferase family glycosyltransferase [Janthinobacterium lividum]
MGTAFGLATVGAAYEAGLLVVDGPQVLVVVASSAVPEEATPLAEIEGVTALLGRFDAVHDLNEAIAPRHPRRWRPCDADLPGWERRLRLRWGLGDDDVSLLTESVAGEPAHALARIFAEAPLEVYADGLMSYGPTGGPVTADLGDRLRRLLHLDLVPGLVPALHREWGVEGTVIPSDALRDVVRDGLAEHPSAPGERPPTALVLGQYLAADGLMDDDEELDLYAEMVRRCVDAGYARVVFKQHPSAPSRQGEDLPGRLARAERPPTGVSVARRAELAEAWYAGGRTDLVVACFSTALLTAATCYGLPVARLGTGSLLERLTSTTNLNLVPVLLVDATVPDLATQTPGPVRVPEGLQGVLDAVSYVREPPTGSGPAPGRPTGDGCDPRRPDAAG